MNNSSTGLPNQQGQASSLPDPQPLNQLNQLYNVLQSLYPDWCRENPFESLVNNRSDAELGGLAVSWNQCIADCHAQLYAPGPMM